jgi:hypothetical protein
MRAYFVFFYLLVGVCERHEGLERRENDLFYSLKPYKEGASIVLQLSINTWRKMPSFGHSGEACGAVGSMIEMSSQLDAGEFFSSKLIGGGRIFGAALGIVFDVSLCLLPLKCVFALGTSIFLHTTFSFILNYFEVKAINKMVKITYTRLTYRKNTFLDFYAHI